MKTFLPLGAVLALLLIAGCVRSLHPLYTEEDLEFDPALLGTWTDPHSDDTWVFSKGRDRAFDLVYTDGEGKTGEFVVHLVKLKDRKFLDFQPKPPNWKQNDFYVFHILPVHTIALLESMDPTLNMRFPEMEWVKNYLRANPEAIRHEWIDGEPLLTDSTEAMQRFWLGHVETKRAFGERSELARESPSAEDEESSK